MINKNQKSLLRDEYNKCCKQNHNSPALLILAFKAFDYAGDIPYKACNIWPIWIFSTTESALSKDGTKAI